LRRIAFDVAVQSDLRNAKRYLEEQGPGLGEDFLSRVRKQFQHILLYPRTGKIVEHGVRKIGMEKFKFEIYYLVDDEEIFVIAVLHQRRHPDFWKNRL
jgi:plasmid stabilization system protein ParE